MCMCVERERDRDRDRQTDRQTEIETEGETDRQTGRHKERQRHAQREGCVGAKCTITVMRLQSTTNTHEPEHKRPID